MTGSRAGFPDAEGETMPTPRLTGTLAVIVTAGLIAVTTFAGTPNLDPQNEAQQMRREAELLLREADRLEMEAHERERRELVERLDEVRELERLMRQVDELHAQGRVAEAERLASQIDQRIINNERAARVNARSPRREMSVERDRGSWWWGTTTATSKRRRATDDRKDELETQIHHMEIAAEHLEAAGMHDSADQLRAHIELVSARLHDGRAYDPLASRERELTAEIAALDEQLDALRVHVVGLTEVVEKLQNEVEAMEGT